MTSASQAAAFSTPITTKATLRSTCWNSDSNNHRNAHEGLASRSVRLPRTLRNDGWMLNLYLEPWPDSHLSRKAVQIEKPPKNFVENEAVGREQSLVNGLAYPSNSLTFQRTQPKVNVTLLLIDHYDSFTYNLYDMLAQCTVEPPVVLAKDALDGWPSKMGDGSSVEWLNSVDGIILSPGPGTPYAQPNFSKQAITENPDLPILGVCLGHQMMAATYGATVDTAPTPIHGQTHDVQQTSVVNPLFEDLPQTWKAMRYHSLAVLPDSLRDNKELLVTAKTIHDGVIQGIAHTKYPHYGVQFHPESVGSVEIGQQLLHNFCNICHQHKMQRAKDVTKAQLQHKSGDSEIQLNSPQSSEQSNITADETILQHRGQQASHRFRTFIHPVPNHHDIDASGTSSNLVVTPEQVFQHFYEQESHSIWLDSSRAASPKGRDGVDGVSPTGGVSGTISILAAPTQVNITGTKSSTKHARKRLVEYHQKSSPHANDKGKDKMDILTWLQDQLGPPTDDVRIVRTLKEESPETFSAEIDVVSECDFVSGSNDGESPVKVGPGLEIPFDYRGGYLGYLGYSVRRDTERYLQEQEKSVLSTSPSTAMTDSIEGDKCQPLDEEIVMSSRSSDDVDEPARSTPSAAFLLAERSMVFHHPTQQWYLVGLVDEEGEGLENEGESKMFHWMKQTCDEMALLQKKLRLRQTEEFEKVEGVNNNKVKKTNGESVVVNGEKEIKNGRSNQARLESSSKPLLFVPNRPKETYERNIAECQEQIRLGESYELCLTNQLEATVPSSLIQARGGPLGLYKVLRRRNPAPYAAFLNWNLGAGVVDSPRRSTSARDSLVYPMISPSSSSSMAICCSSPERFISVLKRKRRQSDGSGQDKMDSIVLEAEAKPIKGTRARVMPKSRMDTGGASQSGILSRTKQECEMDIEVAQELQDSIKDRAENYMIVDLLRNDMSRVCRIGSVHAAKLMAIESYTTVHQMVSTIRGTLSTLAKKNGDDLSVPSSSRGTPGSIVKGNIGKRAEERTYIDLLKACFPGGSMTGAPKLRTMELLDEMEEHVDRGPYSGSLGYLSVNGCMDMNIIIRSAVITPDEHQDNDLIDSEGSKKNGDGSNFHSCKISVGAGGAITALSNIEEEYSEMMLKARAIVQSAQDWASGSAPE